ncbi:MAG: YbbR-like domain-containing protein [Phaeodactylibacter sp.]|nr:YbbR-like domain-containing protein [Phaeodactylibacter sp.]MCB9288417.1 YbbR-like domain-containing protein [Lewinellaceae bacterium]
MIRINRKAFTVKIREDRATLLACIGIAFVFWLLIKLSQTYRAEKQVLFQFEIPSDKALATLAPNDMTVQLEGTGWDLMFDFFSSRTVKLSYDMSGITQLNLNRARLRSDIAQNLNSNDISIMEINPESLNLTLEDKSTKPVPVIVRDSLNFAPEHHLKSPVKVSPDSVEIAGPASLVSTIDKWYTDSLQLDNLKTTTTQVVKLEKPPRELSVSVNQVEAQIEVEPFTEKTMYIPLVIKNAPDSLRIFPDKINISCKLGLSKYDSVSFRDFIAEVDLKGISANAPNNSVPVVITQKPDFVESLQYTPKSAKFFIVEQPEETEAENPKSE